MTLEVLIDISTQALDRVFDYSGEAEVGCRVLVPFGKKSEIGFVVAVKEKSDYKGELKSVLRVLDKPLNDEMLSLMNFMRDKFYLRYIDIIRLFIPPSLRLEADATLKRLFVLKTQNLTELVKFKNAPKQAELAEYLLKNGEISVSKASELFGTSAIGGLCSKGYAVKYEKEVERKPFDFANSVAKDFRLTSAQSDAVGAIEGCSGKFLLHGVTGSGKTVVYQKLIENALGQGKTAIMLVPEISLTPQVLKFMRATFGDLVAILHSGLSQGERFDEWKRLKKGDAKIAIGARSAIFAPLENVGVIIIDEEHDSSYISDSNPRFDTKTVAEYRAAYNRCPLVLGSATPDIETYKKATEGEYKLIKMPDRVSGATLPKIDVVDMSEELRRGNDSIFSKELVDGLKQTLCRGEKAMIYINRRGFSSFVMCRDCGYIPKCTDCDVSLTYHKFENRLKCHYCGKAFIMPDKCPKCNSTKIRHGRTGTQKVKEEVERLVEGAKVIIMDNDTTSKKGSHFEILDKFAKGEANVLVGTQMIAKGHDFPDVTFVGILDADFSLFFDDYRSSERTFQLVTQVAGRAGRADKTGKVVLQTYTPHHYVFRYAQSYDYDGFYQKEVNARQVTKFPPFSVIVRVLCSDFEDETAFKVTKNIYTAIKDIKTKCDDFIYLSAMRSPVNKVQNKFRYQVLMRLKCENSDNIIKEVFAITDKFKAKTNCFVEINPQSLN